MKTLPPMLLCALVSTGCPTEPAPGEPVDEPPPGPVITIALEDAPEVDDAVQAVIDAAELTGVVVGIARGQEIVYLKGFGYEDVEAEIPVDPSATLFRWASLSKSVVGVVAAQGLADGITSLEAEVEGTVPGYLVPDRYLPGDCQASACAEATPEGTTLDLHQLLTHTGGIQHYANGLVYPVPPISETDDPFVNTGIAWAIEYFQDAPLVSRPGVAYDYTTFGFNLAGVVLEEQYGERLGDVVDAGISDVLGMSTMSPDFLWEDLPRRAVGYVRDDNSIELDGDNDVSWKLPGGGFISSGEDLTRYCAGLLGDALLSIEERDEILWGTGDAHPDYGLGFGVGSWNGERRISHTGAQQKTKTAFRMLPDSDLCFTVMTNATWANPGSLVNTVADAWLFD